MSIKRIKKISLPITIASCLNFCNFATVAEDDLESQILQYLLLWCWDYKYAHTIMHG